MQFSQILKDKFATTPIKFRYCSYSSFLPSSNFFSPKIHRETNPVMPQSILTTNHHHHHHHRSPPPTTAICSSLPTLLPSLPTSIPFPPAKFGYTLTFSPYRSTTTTTTTGARNRAVVCMAKERRVKMVAKQIQRELSDMLLTDQVLQYAILPEAALGADRYLSSLTTISDVEVSSDLQVVKVYVSVFGDERGKEVAISGLKAKAKYVRGQLGKRMKLRLTPEVRFIEDESLERGSRVIAILDKIKSEKTIQNPEVDQDESSDPNDDNEEWEDDDPDDDIIYVK